jgi:hypothetical protein
MTRTLDERLSEITAVTKNVGHFDPKLDMDQKCQMLALHRAGVSNRDIGQIVGLDRRTVGKVYSVKSGKYKNIREIEEQMGRTAFQERYLTEEVIEKLKSVRAVRSVVPGPHPNRSATSKRGIHTVQDPDGEATHRVQIDWVENEGFGAGWYYRDLDSDKPNEWFHCGTESRLTSTACFEAMKGELIF